MKCHRSLALCSWLAGFLAPVDCAFGEPFSRDLSTDCPDATESPFTVEAGRFQVEIEAVRWGRKSEAGVRDETLVVGATNFKYGLGTHADLQVIVEPWIHARTSAAGQRETVDGIGDTTVRLKVNFLGNDLGDFAAGVMPFIKLPTADGDIGNGNLEGGVIVPVAWSFANGWGVGAMAELDLLRNEADDGYELGIVTTATAARDLTESVGFFVEIANEATEGDAETWVTTFNAGLTLALSADRQLDVGVNLGLSDAAEDVALFLGYSTRW